MSSGTDASYYDVLGVDPDAPADAVHQAYLDRARRLHPDRYVDASPGQQAEAERRMREVNEAWGVLRDPARRRRYDRDRLPAVDRYRAAVDDDDDRFGVRFDGTAPDDADLVDTFDGTARIIRSLPWIIVGLILFSIFVFTAYAATGNGARQPAVTTNQCVVVTDEPTVTPASCDTPGARHVVRTVSASQPCPQGSERVQPLDTMFATCLEVR